MSSLGLGRDNVVLAPCGAEAFSERGKALDFGVIIWFLASLSVVFGFAASGYFPPLFSLTLAAAGVLMLFVLFSGSPSTSLLFAVVFVVTFNATYHPLFGMISGLQGAPSGLYRIALGLRSAWVAAALVFVVGYAFLRSKTLRKELLRPSVLALVVLFTSLMLSNAPIDARITYLFNSFLPLFAAVCCVPVVFRAGTISPMDGRRLADLVLVGMLIGATYFFILPLTYDFFRPDLGSFLRGRPGEYIPYGSFEGSWGTRIHGYVFNRFVGTFPDPIICGYFLACTSFALFVTGSFRYAFVLLFFLLISLSKGAWLLFFQACLLYWVLLRRPRWIVFVVVSCLVVQLLLATVLEASNRTHFLGLVGGITSVLHGGLKVLVFGFGIGDGGNLARAYVVGGALGTGWLGSGSESGVGVLVHQLGLLGAATLGFIAFRVFRILIITDKPTSNRRRGDAPSTYRPRLATAALLLSLFLNMPLQENCINISILSSVLLAVLLISSLGGAPQKKLVMVSVK